MSQTVVSPNYSIKIKNRNAARKIKNGSPRLQEELRERYRKRIHERRNELFCKKRLSSSYGLQEVQDKLRSIVRNEFDIQSMENFTNDSFHTSNESPMEVYDSVEIQEDIEEQWIIEEYQRLYAQEIQSLTETEDNIMCPVCEKSFLEEWGNYIVCSCGLKLPIQNNFQNFKTNFKKQIAEHSAICIYNPVLYVDTEKNLCMLCEPCNTFNLL